MNWLRCVLVLLLGTAAVMVAPTARAGTTCSAEMTSLNFNSANPADGTATATIDYECLSVFSPARVAVAMCFAIGPGSVGGSSVLDRRMAHTQSPGDQVAFQIYKDPAHSSIWGDSAAAPSHLSTSVEYDTFFSFGYQRGSIQVYGKLPDLSQVAAGDYLNTFADARLIYSYREGNNPNLPRCDQGNSGTVVSMPFQAMLTVPPQCSVMTASDMDFSPGGMPLTGTSTGTLTSNSTIDLECTKRTAWQVGLDDGLHASGGSRQMCNSGGACLSYQLNQPDGVTPWGDDLDVDTVEGISSGGPQSLSVIGRINDQPLTQAGRYSDTVKVILTY